LDEIVGRPCIRLVEWVEPHLETRGVDPRSQYVECYWLPILGPSTTWLLRFFAWQLERAPGGADLVLADVARHVGLGDRIGRHAPFFRTVGRAVDFSMVHVMTPGVIAARLKLPLLSARHLARLPESLRLSHAHFSRTTGLTDSNLTTASNGMAINQDARL
ncbi:MAG: hypothetical protein WB770_02740, partial [Acidimicrobiales bacterium]